MNVLNKRKIGFRLWQDIIINCISYINSMSNNGIKIQMKNNKSMKPMHITLKVQGKYGHVVKFQTPNIPQTTF